MNLPDVWYLCRKRNVPRPCTQCRSQRKLQTTTPASSKPPQNSQSLAMRTSRMWKKPDHPLCHTPDNTQFPQAPRSFDTSPIAGHDPLEYHNINLQRQGSSPTITRKRDQTCLLSISKTLCHQQPPKKEDCTRQSLGVYRQTLRVHHPLLEMSRKRTLQPHVKIQQSVRGTTRNVNGAS